MHSHFASLQTIMRPNDKELTCFIIHLPEKTKNAFSKLHLVTVSFLA